ncbi:hypothetical protein CEY00_Acc11468 [Actinidia chinensis var. chinensis]|uniref:Uncharacterized protein n=1 Tax=Actinidia chinensis var. chinensis TaxID=1590841 RepID=A0A2R6R2I1_ACTCC|nr:hypothetical protein CEY00_Acc11468 [Actinidia chinensis var. chinensis]
MEEGNKTPVGSEPDALSHVGTLGDDTLADTKGKGLSCVGTLGDNPSLSNCPVKFDDTNLGGHPTQGHGGGRGGGLVRSHSHMSKTSIGTFCDAGCVHSYAHMIFVLILKRSCELFKRLRPDLTCLPQVHLVLEFGVNESPKSAGFISSI